MTIENELDESQYSLGKTDAQYRAPTFAKARKVTGKSYGAQYHTDEHGAEIGDTPALSTPVKRGRGRPPKAQVAGTPLNVHPLLTHLFGGGVRKESVDMIKSMMLESIKTAEYEDAESLDEAVAHNEDNTRELHLYADNHADLYRQRITPIINNLAKKHAKGTYDHEKAKKLWKYAADDAAQRYTKEHGGHGHGSHGSFSPADRREVASRMADEHAEEHGWK